MNSEDKVWVEELVKLRPLLILLARQNLNPRLWSAVDPSGVVQVTLAEAATLRHQYQGDSPKTLEGWIRGVLLHNLYDAIRKAHRGMRDVDREVSLEAAFVESTGTVKWQLAAEVPSPSEVAMKGEEIRGLAAALERLEPAQREAVELRYLQGRSLSDSASVLGRSESAVAALLHRGLVKLKQELRKKGDA